MLLFPHSVYLIVVFAGHGDGVDHQTHRIDRRLIRRVLVPPPDPARRERRGRLRHAYELECEVAIRRGRAHPRILHPVRRLDSDQIQAAEDDLLGRRTQPDPELLVLRFENPVLMRPALRLA